MRTIESQKPLSRPGLVACLKTGFDAIANHIVLILFPLALDILIWLGPHLKFNQPLQAFFDQMEKIPGWNLSPTGEMFQVSREFILERMNIVTSLRSYPVGVPSLMSGISPMAAPYGQPLAIQIPSLLRVFGFWLFLSLSGLAVGALFYLLVAQASLEERINWRMAITEWPKTILQVWALAGVWVVLLIIISLPSSCMISVFTLMAGPVGQLTLFLYLGLLLWFFFPLFFSAHGIFVYKVKMMASVVKSIQLSRMTFPITAGMFLLIMVISQGLDIVWRLPAEDSWLMLIGLVGHAFVATGLLAASFIYYREANQWAQKMVEQMRSA